MVFEVEGVELFLALCVPAGIGGHPEKLQVADAGDLDRVLKAKEHAEACPFLRFQREEVVTAITHGPSGDAIRGVTSEDLGKGAFAAAVPPHHGMNFTGANLQIHTFKDGLILHGRMQVGDIEKQLSVRADHGGRESGMKKMKLVLERCRRQPTEPSSLRARSLSASAANSIGN